MYLICIDLTLMAFSDIFDAIIFQRRPIIPDPHYLSCHYMPIGMCTINPFMNLMYDPLSLVSVDTPQQCLVFTLLVKNISIQEESHG